MALALAFSAFVLASSLPNGRQSVSSFRADAIEALSSLVISNTREEKKNKKPKHTRYIVRLNARPAAARDASATPSPNVSRNASL
jgi:hypothetical protein